MSSEKTGQSGMPTTRQWVKPELRRVGDIADIVQGGGGKLSLLADDSGDAPRKPKGQE